MIRNTQRPRDRFRLVVAGIWHLRRRRGLTRPGGSRVGAQQLKADWLARWDGLQLRQDRVLVGDHGAVDRQDDAAHRHARCLCSTGFAVELGDAAVAPDDHAEAGAGVGDRHVIARQAGAVAGPAEPQPAEALVRPRVRPNASVSVLLVRQVGHEWILRSHGPALHHDAHPGQLREDRDGLLFRPQRLD